MHACMHVSACACVCVCMCAILWAMVMGLLCIHMCMSCAINSQFGVLT